MLNLLSDPKMNKIVSTFLAVILAGLVSAQNVEQTNLGSVESMFNRITAEGRQAKPAYSFATTTAERIAVDAKSYTIEKGYLALTGIEADVEGNIVMFKGTESNLYGWIVRLDEEYVAYEYTTNESGDLIVEKVPVSKIIPICNHAPDTTTVAPENAPQFGEGEDHIGSYPGTNLRELESNPGATNVFYCDITRVTDASGNITVGTSATELWRAWQCFASSVSMYDVNITTDRAVYDSYPVQNSGIINWMFEDGRSFAPLHSFGTRSAGTLYFFNSGWGWGRTCAHEAGHQLGMSHDGGAGDGEYFGGIATYKWGPIMGNYWPGNGWGEKNGVFQWSKGEYSGASMMEDDLSVIDGYLGYRPDDITDSRALVYVDGSPETINSDSTRAFIGTTGDEDIFTFQIGAGGGSIDVTIDQIEYCSYLDVYAELRDANGNVIDSDNPQALRYANLSANLDAGLYSIMVTGGSEGTPSAGFSNYGSLGYFEIEGTITNAVNNQLNTSVLASGSTNMCAGDAILLEAKDDVDYVYQWYRNDSPMSGETTYDLDVDESGLYYVSISDGSVTANSREVEVTVIPLPDAPEVTDGVFCNAGDEVELTATAEGTVKWFDTELSATEINEGETYSVVLNETTSFFVSQNTIPSPERVGPVDNSFSDGAYHAGDYYIVFDADKDLVIKSATVYAEGAGTRKFVLTDGSFEIASKEIALVDGENRIDLDFEVTAGTGYQLGAEKLNGVDAQLYRNSGVTGYPYVIDGLISLNQSTAAGVETEYFYYLYDWEVQESGEGCSSVRIEVEAVLDPGCVTSIQERMNSLLEVYPNPSNGIVNINVPSNFNVSGVSLLSVTGEVISQINGSVNSVDVSVLAPGSYLLKIEVDGVAVHRTLIKR